MNCGSIVTSLVVYSGSIVVPIVGSLSIIWGFVVDPLWDHFGSMLVPFEFIGALLEVNCGSDVCSIGIYQGIY